MIRKDLVKLLTQNGWTLKRNGANHDIFTNGTEKETIPRHAEINEQLAKAIIKRRGLYLSPPLTLFFKNGGYTK